MNQKLTTPRPQETERSRRGRILEAATTAFARRGFAGASTREIADAASVADTLLFYYFKSKADLYLAAVRDQLEKLQYGIEAATSSTGGVRERLDRFVTTYLDYFLDYEPGLTVVLRELVGLPPEVAEQIRQIHHAVVTERLEAILGEGVSRGSLRPLNVPVCALAILAILQGYIRREAATPGAIDRTELIAQIMDYYYCGLLQTAAE